jgi:hypothetical protein
VLIAVEQVEGHYKGYIIKKVIFTDTYHYLEPDYIGIFAIQVQGQGESIADLPTCKF